MPLRRGGYPLLDIPREEGAVAVKSRDAKAWLEGKLEAAKAPAPRTLQP